MAITAEIDGDLCRITIEGEMTIFTAQDIKNALHENLSNKNDIEVDLSAVSEIDAAGLQLMVALKLEAIVLDKLLLFTGHSVPVQEILNLSDLSSFFGDQIVIQSQ